MLPPPRPERVDLKEFADQRLPFERFRPNAAFYYLMCIAFFLYEAFKEDVCGDIVPITSYRNNIFTP